MDMQQLEQLGDDLRSLGHDRRQLVEQIMSEVNQKDAPSSIHLYEKLSQVSEQAISLMQKQKSMIDEEIHKIHNTRQ